MCPTRRLPSSIRPPYLFKGARPVITQAPAQIQYGTAFLVTTPNGATIASATLIRAGGVTHFFDQNTRFVPVAFQQTPGGLTVTAPANGNLAPPGYYMLFIVNSNRVPSVAPIMQLGPKPGDALTQHPVHSATCRHLGNFRSHRCVRFSGTLGNPGIDDRSCRLTQMC